MKGKISLILLIIIGLNACQQEPILYKKTFTEEEKGNLVIQMMNDLLKKYYQGTVAERMVLEEALQFAPTSADLWRELGIPYGKRGIAAKYYEYYGKAVANDPTSWQGWRGYMYLYFYRDYERAIVDFNALDTLTPDFIDYPQATSVHFMRAIAYLKLGQYDQALSFLEAHIKEELRTTTEDYIDCKTFLYQGIAHYKKGAIEKARLSIARGLKNADYNADLWFWEAKLALHFKEKKRALAALEKAAIQLNKEYNNYRPYVEDFFQIYQADIDELREKIEEI
jgi:tetratricopeptide (TPR) repeat protein